MDLCFFCSVVRLSNRQQQPFDISKCSTLGLKFGAQLRLTYYEGQLDQDKKKPIAGDEEVYFVAYNDQFEFISASKNLSVIYNTEQQSEYYLKCIKDITVSDKPTVLPPHPKPKPNSG